MCSIARAPTHPAFFIIIIDELVVIFFSRVLMSYLALEVLPCNMLLIEIENNIFENEQNCKSTSENKDLVYELFILRFLCNIISLFLSLFFSFVFLLIK